MGLRCDQEKLLICALVTSIERCALSHGEQYQQQECEFMRFSVTDGGRCRALVLWTVP